MTRKAQGVKVAVSNRQRRLKINASLLSGLLNGRLNSYTMTEPNWASSW